MLLLKHGSKIGNATVIVDIISKNNPKIRPGMKMNPKKVTTHNTGNPGRGANAEMHNRYIHNMASYDPKNTVHVSWHLSVDDKYIYQHIPFDENAWHCGDGNGVNSGNRNSIGIEICENPETDTKQAEENAIALTVLLLKEFKLTAADVVPHQDWSGKFCPRVILGRDGSFVPYRNRVATAFNKKEDVKVASVPKKDENYLNFPTWQKDEMAAIYKMAREKGVFSSAEHEANIKAGKMTVEQAIFLMTSIVGAALNDGVRVK